MRKLFLAIALSLSLGACADLSRVGDLVTTITQPVGLNTEYQVEAAAYAARRATVEYFRLRQCRRTEVASLINRCSRYSIKVRLQTADRKLSIALTKFRANPTIYAAVRAAITNYQDILATTKVN